MKIINTMQIDRGDVHTLERGRSIMVPEGVRFLSWSGGNGSVRQNGTGKKMSAAKRVRMIPCGTGSCDYEAPTASQVGSHRFKAHGIRAKKR